MNMLGNIRIRNKAFILIGTTIFTVITMFLVSYQGMVSIKLEIRELLLATNVERKAYETILQEKNYLLNSNGATNNPALAAAAFSSAEANVKAINETLDKIDEGDDPTLKAKSKAARDGTNAYADLYRKGVAALTDLDKLGASLEKDGEIATEQATNYIEASQDPRKTKIALKIRQYAYLIRADEKRYMLNQKPEIFERMKSNFAAMMEQLAILEKDASSDQERQQVATFKAAALNYEKAAHKWVENSDTLFKSILPKMKELGDQVIKLAYGAAEDGAETITAVRNSILMWLMIVGGTIAAAGIVLGMTVANAIARPVVGLTDAMTRLAGGELDVTVPSTGQTDEIGKMAGTLEIFKDNLIAKKAADEAAAIDAKQKMQHAEHLDKATHNFQQAIGAIVDVVASASTQLSTTAETLTAAANQTSAQSSAVAAASEQASNNVQTVASAAEELSSSIREITQQVQQSATIAQTAAHAAKDATGAVQHLTEMAGRIGNIINLINDIAGQTNLLALNATIEAARAGEAGRGFAVVAQEVKALAEQTAKATAEISSQVTAIQDSTHQTTTSIASIAKTIEDINASSTAISAAVEEQGAATQEIARNAHQTSQATNEVARNITGVQDSAESSSAAATDVLSASRALAHQSEALRNEVNRFLNEVRAA